MNIKSVFYETGTRRAAFGSCVMLFILAVAPALSARAQGTPKPLDRDETWFALARRNVEVNESPMSNVVGVLDEIVEVGEITPPDATGKVTVTLREKAPASASHQQKSIRVTFVPAGKQWRWDAFEDRAKFYPVDRLFPYAKGEILKSRTAADNAWKQLTDAMSKQGEAAWKVLDTTKTLIKAEPLPMGPVKSARESLTAALTRANETGDFEIVRGADRELITAIEPVPMLGDRHAELKANDAYLRLQEELTGAKNNLAAARKNYYAALATYNEVLRRVPFGLVAYGLGFVRLEPRVSEE
ncbi:MAG: LemA family protein [Blastocatellia bacterium]